MQKGPTPAVTIGAIDNSLSWPWKHPDAVSNTHCTSMAITNII
jgi:phosphatidylinositol 4-kinase type 2